MPITTTRSDRPPHRATGSPTSCLARDRAAQQWAQRQVSELVTALGFDPFAPFWGLERHRGLVQVRSAPTFERTLRRLLLRRAGAKDAGALARRAGVPAEARRAFGGAFDAAVALHATRLFAQAGRWQRAREEVPALGGLERHAARCVDQYIARHPADTPREERQVVGLVLQALWAKGVPLESALMRNYGIPGHADDFAAQRHLLRTRLQLHATEHFLGMVRAATAKRYAAAQLERRAEGLEILFEP